MSFDICFRNRIISCAVEFHVVENILQGWSLSHFYPVFMSTTYYNHLIWLQKPISFMFPEKVVNQPREETNFTMQNVRIYVCAIRKLCLNESYRSRHFVNLGSFDHSLHIRYTLKLRSILWFGLDLSCWGLILPWNLVPLIWALLWKFQWISDPMPNAVGVTNLPDL